MNHPTSYEIYEVHVGSQSIFRFTLKGEGGRTYYSPLFFRTSAEAADKARRVLESAGVTVADQRI